MPLAIEILLGVLLFAWFASWAWSSSRSRATTVRPSSKNSATSPSSPALPSPAMSSATPSAPGLAGPHLLKLPAPTANPLKVEELGSRNSFWPFALLASVALPLVLSLAVGTLLLSPLLRTIHEGNVRQDRLDGARKIETVNQAHFLVEQERSLRLMKRLNEQLKAIVEGD